MLQTNQAALKTYAIAFALSYLTAGIGGGLTELGPWYFALKHPEWKPPDPYFGVIWSTIFTLCAISGGMAWRAAQSPEHQKRVLVLFGVNAFLNIFWSALYFKLQRPDWAVFEVVFLWLSIMLLVMGLWRLSQKAAYLLIPYWVWVSVATVLNVHTVKLNGPFTGQ
jgi:benzodiazapine receptor